jgi:AGZA family xanthine/uracil permease-like MFS transporter
VSGAAFERLFRIAEHVTSIRTEVVAGLTTFLTMSYIVFVNPQILALNALTGRSRAVPWALWIVAAAFLADFLRPLFG